MLLRPELELFKQINIKQIYVLNAVRRYIYKASIFQYFDPIEVDTEGNTPVHLAARWCAREENYCNAKLVMTPLIKGRYIEES